MSLKSLLIVVLGTLLTLRLIFVFIINLNDMQEFLENQVYSTSQDTAYSLGIALSTLDNNASNEDMELMINAIFDSGYYEYIRLYDTDKKLKYEASLPIIIKDVPSWYVSVVPLHLQEATADLNHGWNFKGSLAIKSHAGYAYYELYKTFKELLVTFSIVAIVSFVVLLFVINMLLRSLERVKEQANAISEHKFIIEKKKSFISEFDILTKSMNQMVKKVEGIFLSEVQTFEQLQNVLYRDEESTLPNKKYFILKLKEILDDESRNLGYLAIISVDGLERLKKEKSYTIYKETLMNFISSFPKDLTQNNLVSRISDNEIAILFNTHNVKEIEDYFEKLQGALSITSRHVKTKEKLFCFSIGVAPYFEDDQISQALSRVDYSLSRSKINGCNIIDIYEDTEHEHELITLGKGSWKEMFDKIFDDNRIILAMQSTINNKDSSIFHDEVLVRIREDDGSLQTAGYYLPMANALGLISKFDYTVIRSVIENINSYTSPVAINISKEYILKSEYFVEMRNRISKLRISNPKQMHFECAENEILTELNSYIEFSDMVHAHNQLFGIDRFSGIENISYIEKIRPDYVKINVNFIMESMQNNKAILNTLNVLSRTMGIKLIITAVQSEEQHEQLKEAGYSNFQGIFISDIRV